MGRTYISGGGWFDPEKATKFSESTHWDGRNHISNATGSQWEHEAVFRTAKGAWVLNRWSQWQGSKETYERISADEAAKWLARHGHDAAPGVSAEIAASEI